MAKYSETADDMNPWKSYAMNSSLWANQYLGTTTNPMAVNQIQELMRVVPSGIQNVEIGILKPGKEGFEAVPADHFKKLKQLAKLTIRDFEKEGKPSPLSMHAPLIEPTGFSENKFNEDQWKQNQEQLKNVIEKAADLGTSTPVTIHGSHQVSDIWRIDDKGKEYHDVMAVVDPENGQVQFAKKKERQYPTGKQEWTPEQDLTNMNYNFWEKQRQELAEIENQRDRTKYRIQQISNKSPNELTEEDYRRYPDLIPLVRAHGVFTHNLFSHINAAFDKAHSAAKLTGDKEQLRELKEIQIKDRPEAIVEALNKISSDRFNPPVFVPVEKFARNKASETFAELAMESVRVAKQRNISPEKGPMICIENVFPEAAFGRGETMKALIVESRNKFFKKAVESGMGSSEARKLSDKLIGATWDVGHINLLKKYGYDDKRLKKELKHIQEDIKHIHLTDNFGYDDAHLVPGMGNVPIKETLKELEKAGKMGKIRAIVEAGGFINLFKQDPVAPSLSYMNAPLYSSQASPGWQELGTNYFFGSSGYVPGYGKFLPSEHFSMYGAGFSQLPTALGGRKPGEKSKFAGTPMS